MAKDSERYTQTRDLKNEEALRAYFAAGSWKKASEKTGIADTTLRDRANRLPSERAELIRKEARGQIVTDMTALLFLAIGAIPKQIPNASLRDLVGLLKVGIEKVLLMEGEATSRTEHSQLDQALTRALAEMQEQDEKTLVKVK